jgi:hypothetical protein
MSQQRKVVPIDSLLDDAPRTDLACDPRDELSDADVIVAVDGATQQEFLIFGRETLQRIVDRGSAEARHVMHVGVDRESDDVERLCALVKAVKGRCDFPPT